MKNSLIQEQRTDKNGVTKRMWVKPSTGSLVDSNSIPAPQPVDSAQKVSEQRDALVASIGTTVDEMSSWDDDYDGAEMREKLDEFETRTLIVLNDNMPTEDDTEGQMLVHELLGAFTRDEPTIRNVLSFRDCFEWNADAGRITYLTDGLHSYDMFGDDEELCEMTGDRMETARSLCKVSNALLTTFPNEGGLFDLSPKCHIRDKSMVQLIADHPQRGEDIANLIRERETDDVDLIRSIIENETPLRVGTL
jgi:hypothetical protein